MTAFLLGWVPELRYFTCHLRMTCELRKRLTEVTGVTDYIFGDVAAIYENEILVHTAVFVGSGKWSFASRFPSWSKSSGKWLHQIGWNYPVMLNDFQAMRDSYKGSLRIYR